MSDVFSVLDLRELGRMSQAQAIDRAMDIRRARARAARDDYNEFASFVLRDEVTGKPLKQAWTHMDWAKVRMRHRNALIIAHVEAGKTQQFSVGTVLWSLGRNPNMRIVVVSRTQTQASKVIRAAAQYIERSPECRMVFPHLRPGERSGDKWTETMLTVHRDGIGIKEPSLQAFGLDGSITGSRVDGFVFDDILDERNTRTKALRDHVEAKFWRQFWNRRSKNDPWAYFVGNAWHPEDLYSKLEELGWPTYRYPVIVTEELVERGICDLDGPLEVGTSTWPAHWPESRIADVRSTTPPLEFARAYMCVSRDDADARFKRSWLESAAEQGREAGIHSFSYDLAHALRSDPFLDVESVIAKDPDVEADAQEVESALVETARLGYWAGIAATLGVRVYTGADLSTGKGKDLTSLFTVMVYPDGDRRVLDIQSGRWQVDEILQRIVAVNHRFGSIVMVENVSAQDYVVQLLHKHTAVPVVPFTTGRNKADPTFGVESLAGELAAGKWIVPCGVNGELHPEVEAWFAEMLFYQPDAHTGDRLMAMWFAREACRRFDPDPTFGGNLVAARVIG